MAQYINKAAVVAEIERRIKEFDEIGTYLSPKGTLTNLLCFLDTTDTKEVEEEPVSNDLEEAARKIATRHSRITGDTYYANDAWFFKKGAQWQKEQMEKNRIEHCDNITEEQYNLETGFLDDFLDKNKRMPTFLDAIEYGMKKATEE